MDHALFHYLLRLGDSTLVLSHRLSEWMGHGPAMEEEMATANVALDLLGQARQWLSLAAEVQGEGADEDSLAYRRDAPAYRNYLLVERPNGHYGDTIVRQWLFDAWHFHLLSALVSSSDARVAAVAAKSLKEVAYHVRRTTDVVVRLGDGTALSHQRMQSALDDAWRHAGELFIDDDVTTVLADAGVAPRHASLHPAWLADLTEVADEATLTLPPWSAATRPAHQGGIHGRHTEALGYLLAEMQHLQRSYPGGAW